jgi:hypothetical protein
MIWAQNAQSAERIQSLCLLVKVLCFLQWLTSLLPKSMTCLECKESVSEETPREYLRTYELQNVRGSVLSC